MPLTTPSRKTEFDFDTLTVPELKDLLKIHTRLRSYESPDSVGFAGDVVRVVKYAQKYTTTPLMLLNPFAIVQELYFELAKFLADSDEA